MTNVVEQLGIVAPLRGIPLPECTVPALLTRQAKAFGDKLLLQIGDTRLSYRQVCETASAMGALLRGYGIQQGDRVCVLSANRLELIETILGCAWIGAVAVPLNVELRGEQLHHALANSGASVLIAESDLIGRLTEFEIPGVLELVWFLDTEPADSPTGCRVESLPARTGNTEPAHIRPGDTAAMLYTSGTTGLSKGVCCPHAQFYWWGINVSEQLSITEADTLYTCLPLFHTNALNAFFQAMVSGATFVVGPRFSARRFWEDVSKSGATVTFLLGAMVNILWSKDAGPYDRAHSVRLALSPATPPALFEPFLERFGFPLLDGFGSTETNSVMSAAPAAPRAGYLGQLQRDFEALVVDENDIEVADGVAGELLLRSTMPFAFATGYFQMPDKTVEAWQNLWFHTGDRVVREPDGWYRFVDRIKDVIRRRGENISSFEVEQVIGLHPAVESAAAYPVPSEMAEDEVMVSLVLKQQQVTDAASIARHCETLLAKFAVPRYIDIVSELPKTSNGKIRKSVLRERGKTTTTWDREAQY